VQAFTVIHHHPPWGVGTAHVIGLGRVQLPSSTTEENGPTVQIGTPAPPFELEDQDRNLVTLESLRGKNTLLVFIPFPYTGICDGEACAIRDNLAELQSLDANAAVITVHARPMNKRWSDENGFDFPVLSDFWPHGATAKAYGAFNEDRGVANRYTFVLDSEGVVRNIINTDQLGVGREFSSYLEALKNL
jgi:peroxiredoxin (alkyl hydroperoxide reductase subunit C)